MFSSELGWTAWRYRNEGYSVVPFDGNQRLTDYLLFEHQDPAVEPKLGVTGIAQLWSEKPNLNVGCNLAKSGLVSISIRFSSIGHYEEKIRYWDIPFTPTQLFKDTVTFLFFQNSEFPFYLNHSYRYVDFVELTLDYLILDGTVDGHSKRWLKGRSLHDIKPAVMPDILARFLQGQKFLPVCATSELFCISVADSIGQKPTPVVAIAEVTNALEPSERLGKHPSRKRRGLAL